MSANAKTREEWIDEAIALEKKARWSDAAKARNEARRATTAPRPVAAGDATSAYEARRTRAELRRVAFHGITVGTVLEHRRWGKLEATCVYQGPRSWLFNGVSYTSIWAAAQAASQSLGKRSTAVNGWTFFGVEKQETDHKERWLVQQETESAKPLASVSRTRRGVQK